MVDCGSSFFPLKITGQNPPKQVGSNAELCSTRQAPSCHCNKKAKYLSFCLVLASPQKRACLIRSLRGCSNHSRMEFCDVNVPPPLDHILHVCLLDLVWQFVQLFCLLWHEEGAREAQKARKSCSHGSCFFSPAMEEAEEITKETLGMKWDK